MSEKLTELTHELTSSFVKDLQEKVSKQVTADVSRRLAQVDVQQLVGIFVKQAIDGVIKDFKFPAHSIPADAINTADMKISGDSVIGGIIQQFGSTGIQDNATTCQVTILDQATVIENKLVTSGLDVKGDVTIDGDLLLSGEIPADSPFYRDVVEHAAGLLKMSLNDDFFSAYATKVKEQINAEGIDVPTLKIKGGNLIDGNKLANFVTQSNIQTLGELKQLRVAGEAAVYDTLYVGNKRVGINTLDPAGALSVWDEECEMVGRKYKKDVAMFGTIRPQQLILSSNGKSNVILESDGSVSIDKVKIGNVEMTSATSQPKHDAKKGSIVWNETPDVGKPLFWVSLGGARWAAGGVVC